jgi:hypothetical protein
MDERLIQVPATATATVTRAAGGLLTLHVLTGCLASPASGCARRVLARRISAGQQLSAEHGHRWAFQ